MHLLSCTQSISLHFLSIQLPEQRSTWGEGSGGRVTARSLAASQRRGRKCVTVMAVVARLPFLTRPCLLRAM